MKDSIIKVLHVIASAELGGGPEAVWQLVTHFPAGIESYIAAPRRYPYWERFRQAVGKDHLFEIPQRSFSIRQLFHLLRWTKKHNIDIIHSHGRGGGVYGRPVAWLANIANIHTFHGIHVPQRFGFLYVAQERILGSISTKFITVSQGERNIALSALKLPEDKICTIPNGVQIPDTVQGDWKPPFTIAHFTRFDPIKNSTWLIAVAKELRSLGRLQECRFIILGDGNGRQAMQATVDTAAMSPHFAFMGAQSDPRSYLQGAGCYFSASFREGLPLAVLESQAEGIPCVVSDVVGNREAIEDGQTGFLFPLGDACDAAQKILMLMDDRQRWQKMSAAAHNRAHQFFSIRLAAERTAKSYQLLTPPREE